MSIVDERFEHLRDILSTIRDETPIIPENPSEEWKKEQEKVMAVPPPGMHVLRPFISAYRLATLLEEECNCPLKHGYSLNAPNVPLLDFSPNSSTPLVLHIEQVWLIFGQLPKAILHPFNHLREDPKEQHKDSDGWEPRPSAKSY
ncbi:unnamed protein product [Cylicocyclus nassatus]|uniref:Uncharacterized protein n=1 Tax=Cylicocyclus nassatus TaxID=53992 RepID=A0AA36DJK5_CYLNA|nr:unnamed protein product [Cylicocyclus nassatus]